MFLPHACIAAALVALGGGTRSTPDEPFSFHSPFGSDGTNQAGLTASQHDEAVLRDVWGQYVVARSAVFEPLPQSPSYPQHEFERDMRVMREGELLFAMAQLRACIEQKHPDNVSQSQLDEVERIDEALAELNLRYSLSGGAQAMTDFCVHVRFNRVMRSLRPILYHDDGSRRPLPRWVD